MADSKQIQSLALGFLGAAIGGCVGYFLFFWVARQGFYALIIPAALLGWGAGLGARRRSMLLAVTCAIAGFALGVITEWKFAPFAADQSFLFFISHIHKLKPVTLLMLALGTFFSYRLALGFDRTPRSQAP